MEETPTPRTRPTQREIVERRERELQKARLKLALKDAAESGDPYLEQAAKTYRVLQTLAIECPSTRPLPEGLKELAAEIEKLVLEGS